MSFNGSGTFLINTAGQPVVSGTVISSTAFNALTADLATGLSTAITKDGQTTVTANIPMSTYKFTGLGVGSADTPFHMRLLLSLLMIESGRLSTTFSLTVTKMYLYTLVLKMRTAQMFSLPRTKWR